MGLRIALTGPHGTGKDTLVEHIRQVVVGERLAEAQRVRVIPSSSRHVLRVSGESNNQDTTDWFQLWSAVQRRLWCFEAEAEDGAEVVLSPRTGLDEVAYQGVWLARQHNEIQRDLAATPKIIMPTNGGEQIALSPEMQKRMAMANRSETVLGVLLEQASYEVAEWWDVVYWKRPKPGVQIAPDGVRPVEEDFQDKIDRQLEMVVARSPLTPHIGPKVRLLPVDVEEAKAFLEGEAAFWRTLSQDRLASA